MLRWGLALSVLWRTEEARTGMSSGAACKEGHAAALRSGRYERGRLCHLMAQQLHQPPVPDKGCPSEERSALQ